MSAKDLTVVIPHYDHGTVLPRAVASVLAQRGVAAHILIVDDGSAREDRAVAQRLAGEHSSIDLLALPKNQGVVAALNAGLAEVSTTFVAFLGADDLWLPDLARTLIPLLENHRDAAFVCSRVALLNRDGAMVDLRPFAVPARNATYLPPHKVAERLRSSDNWILNSSVIYRTSHLRDIGGFDPALGSFCDALLVRELAARSGFCFSPQILAAWTIGADSYSATTAQDPDAAMEQADRARKALDRSTLADLFPDYGALHDRRLRFNVLRNYLGWREQDADPVKIAGLVHRNPKSVTARFTRSIASFSVARAPGRKALLACATIIMRPYGWGTLIASAISNGLAFRRNRARVEKLVDELTAQAK